MNPNLKSDFRNSRWRIQYGGQVPEFSVHQHVPTHSESSSLDFEMNPASQNHPSNSTEEYILNGYENAFGSLPSELSSRSYTALPPSPKTSTQSLFPSQIFNLDSASNSATSTQSPSQKKKEAALLRKPLFLPRICDNF